MQKPPEPKPRKSIRHQVSFNALDHPATAKAPQPKRLLRRPSRVANVHRAEGAQPKPAAPLARRPSRLPTGKRERRLSRKVTAESLASVPEDSEEENDGLSH